MVLIIYAVKHSGYKASRYKTQEGAVVVTLVHVDSLVTVRKAPLRPQ